MGPEESAQARSMEFSSSLTLPGQSCSIMVRNASSAQGELAPCSRLMWSRKCAAKSGMSSRRSRNEGRRRFTTLSR